MGPTVKPTLKRTPSLWGETPPWNQARRPPKRRRPTNRPAAAHGAHLMGSGGFTPAVNPPPVTVDYQTNAVTAAFTMSIRASKRHRLLGPPGVIAGWLLKHLLEL